MPKNKSFRAATVIVGAVILAATSVTVSSSASAASTGSTKAALTGIPVVIGTAPALPLGAKTVGVLPAVSSIDATLTLNPSDAAGLTAYAMAASTPGNPLYRHFLTTAAFAAKFGPSAAAIESVRATLTADGLHPDQVSANHLAIQIHGATAAFSATFGTNFNSYRLSTGRIAYANTSAPTLASSIASSVQTVIGLNNLVLAHSHGTRTAKRQAAGRTQSAEPHVVTGGPQPCPAAVAAAPTNAAYTADQIAAAYQLNGLYAAGDFGQGQTIAMYELEANTTADIAQYQACYGTSTPISYVKIDGGDPAGAGGEATLDIENAISIAPKAAQIVYQGPNSGSGAYDTYNAIISQNKATAISSSWGTCELEADPSDVAAESILFQEAAAQGQSMFDAAGDLGSEDCTDSTHLSADDPGGQPFVTVVGGTTLTNPTATRPTEVLWNNKATKGGAGGAGISRFFKMPFYQSGAAAGMHVINANSTGAPCGAPAGSYCRQEPDVSLVADPNTGFLVYLDGAWTGFGGTSGAAPIWAAFTALANASAGCAGTNAGFINPALYAIAGSAYAANFTDITSGNSDYTGTNGGKYPTAVGYDIASGLGTPKGLALAASLCGEKSSTVTLTSTHPTQVNGTSMGNLTATVSVPGGPTTGSVAFQRGNRVFAIVNVVNGKASFASPAGLGLGANVFTATFRPSTAGIAQSISNPRTITVIQSRSTTTLSSPNPVQTHGHSTAVLKASVSVAAPGSTNGRFAFKRGTQVFAVIAAVNGQASYTVSPALGVGKSVFTATFEPATAGTANSTSAGVTITVVN